MSCKAGQKARVALVSLIMGFGVDLYGQEVTADDAFEERTVLYDSLWPSARAAGTGGALGALADGMDAPYYNPAGIGGLHLNKKQEKKTARFIGFPYVGAEVGENSISLNEEFSSTSGAGNDPMVTQAILDANEGVRQYARFAMVPAFVVSRFMFGYMYDSQVAALSLGQGTDIVRTRQQTTSGPFAGFSATDPGGHFYIGAFAAGLERTTIDADLTFGQVVDPISRKEALSDAKSSYAGTAANVGMLWQISEKGKPSIALVSRNSGDTVFAAKDAGQEDIVIKENLAMAFSVSPQLGKWGFFNFTIEAEHLNDPEIAVEKKMKAGMELTVGGLFGNESGFGIRSGYNSAGASYGIHANLGLVGVQVSSFAEDIGVENKELIERRYVGIVSVNVAH